MFKKFFLYILYKCWQLLAFTLILFAVLITIARYMIPGINDHRAAIEQFITTQSGIQISIGHIEGSWESLGPVFSIQDIRFGPLFHDATEDYSSIQSVNISIATLPTLFYGTLITEQLSINGLSLNIQQQQSGQFSLTGILPPREESPNSKETSNTWFQDWLQNQSKITLFNTHLDIILRNHHEYPIDLDEIVFRKGRNIFQLTGMSKLPGENQIDFTLEVDGFLTEPDSVGQLYIDTHKINMTELPLNAIWEEAEINSGILEMKIWADWKNSQFESALVSLEVDNFLLSLMEENQTNLNKLKTHLVWNRTHNGWQAKTVGTEIISHDRLWPDPSVKLEMEQVEGIQQYQFLASQQDLGGWLGLVMTNPNLDEDIRKQLLSMHPDGVFDEVRLNARMDEGNLLDISAHASFSELVWKPWKNIPGIQNLAGQIELHKDQGTLLLDSRDLQIDYPSLFRWPFDVESLTSRFSWQLSEEQISLNLNELSLDTQGTQLLADGLFDIARETGAVDMNLYAELNNGDVARTKYFLPTGIMSTKLVNYLDRSIKTGSLKNANITLRGPASEFPFTNSEGVFAINAQISDTRYSFTKGWPELHNVEADLWFIENGMDIRVTGANSNGQKVSSAAVSIENFSADPPLLKVISISQGQLPDGIDYLNNSPLKDSVGKIFDVIPAKGPFSLDLELLIPLSSEEAPVVNGNIHLPGNNLVVKPIDMPIDNIKGNISIEDSRIRADKLHAEYMGGKSSINLRQSSDDRGLLQTEIIAQGELSMAGVRDIFPVWIPAQLKGKTNYSTKLLLAGAEHADDTLLSIHVASDLAGVTSQFPAPYEKSGEQPENFSLDYKLAHSNGQFFDITIAERANMKLQVSEASISRGQIVLGNNAAAIPEADGIQLTGSLDKFDLEPWLALLTSSPKDDGDDFSIDPYRQFYIKDLNINQLTYYFMDFTKLNISAEVDESNFIFNVENDEIIGQIIVPETLPSDPIDINLEKLKIADLFPVTDKSPEDEPAPKLSLADTPSNTTPLPPINIRCKECIYKGETLGATELNLSPLDKGNAFVLKMQEEGILSLDIEGNWQASDTEGAITTLSGTGNTKNLGNLLTLLNRETGIHDTELVTSGELRWQGDPSQFNYETLNGKLKFDGGKGNQEDVSDEKVRIFSLLSLSSLARKLTLDFSDLFGKGFFYYGLNGNMDITNGVFRTLDMKIDGTAADVEIKGISDIPNNRIENCIMVTPDLSASLPVIAGWAIEPVTGLVVYLMSKIFQPVMKVVTSIQYKVDGTFDNPVITEVGKSAATVTVKSAEDNSEQTIITPDEEQPQFSCDGVFNK